MANDPFSPDHAMPATPKRAPAADAALRQDAEALHAAITRLVRLYQFRDRERICCHDISVTQCQALETLAERGPLRSQALADTLLLDKSTTTRVVDALVRKGYAERSSDPSDARAVVLSITASGRALHARIDDDLVSQQMELLQGLDPQLRAGATAVIDRLARAAQSRFLAGSAACAPCDTAC